MSYKPLLDCLTIKESPIHGLGVFAINDLKKDMYLGDTHLVVKNGHYPGKSYIQRINFGGFINHSNIPNTTLKELSCNMTDENHNIKNYNLISIKKIKVGEEITLDYTKELCGLSGYTEQEWLNK